MGSKEETTMKVLLLLHCLGLASPSPVSPIAVPAGGNLDQDLSTLLSIFPPVIVDCPELSSTGTTESRLEPGTTSTRLGVRMRARVHRIVPPGPSTLKMDGALSKLKTR